MESSCEYSRIEIPNDPKYASAAAKYVVEIARILGFERQEMNSIETGVRKAIETAIEYSFEPGERATLELSCERTATGIKVAIKDKGLPFGETISALNAADSEADAASTLGKQVFRLKEFMDEVQLYNRGRAGKETVLIKHLKSKTITDYYAECELEPYEAAQAELSPDRPGGECAVRPMRPSEAAEVSKTVYKTYGYSYRNDYVYYPEKIIALNASGRIHSAVAVSGNGEIAGHCALQNWKENPDIAEFAAGVVKPEFRSRGCFAKLTAYLLNRARSEGIRGVFDQAVTNHTYSQLTGLRSGLNDCALLLGLVPPTTIFKGFSEKLSHRLSMVMQFKYLQRPSPDKVFVPAHHKDMVAAIYKNLGMAHNIETTRQAHLKNPDSVFKVNVVTPLNYAQMIVTQYGSNIVQEVGAELKALCLKKIEVINLYLNLFDPGTAQLTVELEKFGFFFAGLLPGGQAAGDALILQYLNNTPIDYDAIRLESDMAKMIFSHVKEYDPNSAKLVP
jgi:anti-sigma regulatory factor (Ser/Thr protein kinase)/GNAT superfamily N-acetyltransferase